MFGKATTLIVLIFISLTACKSSQNLAASSDKPLIVLKLDDLWNEHGLVHPGWQQVIDYLNREKVTGTIGLICDSLEEGDSAYVQWIQDRAAEGYEIWHHGYCHCKPKVDGVEKREFRGTDYAYQADNIAKAQRLAQEKLGITLHSFGAPYNSTDEFTAQALAQIPDIKVWIYKETEAPTDKFVIKRIPEVNIEYPVHVPDLEQFKAGYNQFKEEPILVIQGHPRSWVEDSSRFETFKQIVHFLKSECVRFTTPYAYYQIQQKTF
jgi:peptidoglycan/xylan/chitin deacetylase (PgdA/CDA1 family)